MQHQTKLHHPPHLYLDEKFYFLTAHIYEEMLLINDKRKVELLNQFNKLFIEFKYKWYAYVVLNDHYHLLFKSFKGADLKDIMQKVHGRLSFKWNQEDNCQGRRIFQNYWDYCPDDENDFFTHLNYIHINPIKHKIVKHFGELKNYKFSSYNGWVKKIGEEGVAQCFADCPVGDYVALGDESRLLGY